MLALRGIFSRPPLPDHYYSCRYRAVNALMARLARLHHCRCAPEAHENSRLDKNVFDVNQALVI